ncbi:MAG: Ig-like domain-containing protein [Candidatus Methylomirabilia bacterium]
MKRTVMLPVFVMTLLILAGGAGARTASGKHGPMAKVGFPLASLQQEYQAYVARQGSDKGFKPGNPLLQLRGNRVVIDAVASGNTSALKADLKGLGLQKASSFGRMVSGQLPIGAIKGMAGLGSLKFARPAYAMTRAGLVASQGDEAMRSDVARATFGVDGTGVTVGTLSDSFNCKGGAAADVAGGDLPVGIIVLAEEPGCGSGTDEGRAMMQLIHDVAPGASQAFHTAFNGQADFADGIIELATGAGANVIVDDVIYFAEPMFQDGIIAQAVDTVEANGVSYFSAAGNNDRDAYEAPFRGSGMFLTVNGVPSGELHDFNPGPGVDIGQRIDVPVGSGFIMSFQWDESYFSAGGPGSTSDMDIYVTDRRNRLILASSTTYNPLSGDPVEVLQFINFGGFGDRFNILITNFTGPAPALMKYVRFDLGPGVVVREFDTASGTIYGHTNAAGAEAVGAAFYGDTPEFGVDPPLLESFSSAGPTPILFEVNGARKAIPEVRQKPEIVAPDGTNTTFFGSDIAFDPDTFPNFFGTSAAAPHAAAVAALMLENALLTPAELYAALEDTGLDMGDPGIDDESGFGFIQADVAVASVTAPPADATAPTVTGVTPTDGAIAVAANTNVVVTFSEPVNGVNATTFKLSAGGRNIPSTVTVAADRLSATLDPNGDLANGTPHTVTVKTAVTDDAGNPMAADFTSTFTTAAAAGSLNVTVTTDKASYVNKEKVLITVTVTGGTTPVEGAAVHVDLATANGRRLAADNTSDANGVALFQYKVNSRRDGVGIYTLDVTASKGGFQNGSASATFAVTK